MKTFLGVISFLILTLVSNSKAQFKTGDFEFSFSGSFSSMTVKNSSSSPYYSTSTHSESRNTMDISISPGYYIFDGVSIEAEFGLVAIEKTQPSQYILLNLGYTYLLPDSKVALFAHGGYGFSNSIEVPYLNNAFVFTSNKFNVKVINLGAGVKYLVTPNVIIHTEVNYRIHDWKDEYSSYYSIDNTISNAGLILGVSILLPR